MGNPLVRLSSHMLVWHHFCSFVKNRTEFSFLLLFSSSKWRARGVACIVYRCLAWFDLKYSLILAASEPARKLAAACGWHVHGGPRIFSATSGIDTNLSQSPHRLDQLAKARCVCCYTIQVNPTELFLDIWSLRFLDSLSGLSQCGDFTNTGLKKQNKKDSNVHTLDKWSGSCALAACSRR